VNPGDSVQIYRPGLLFHGYTGILDHISATTHLIAVDLDPSNVGAGIEYFHPEDVQPAEEPS
jgi:hypothetical protein